MGKIGDYIHYHLKNYEIYGNNKNSIKIDVNKDINQSISSNHTQMLSLAKQNNEEKNSLTNELQDDLELALNVSKEQLYRTAMQLDQNGNNQEILNAIKNHIGAGFDEAISQIGWNTLNITSSKEGGINGVSKLYLQSNMKISTIESRINDLVNIINELGNNETTNIEEIQQKMNIIKNSMNNFIAYCKSSLVGDGWENTIINNIQNKNIKQQSYKTKRISNIQSKFKELQEQVNNFISFSLQKPAINLQKGNLFEYFIAYLPLFSLREGSDEINRQLEKIQTAGSTREDVKINPNYFMNGLISDSEQKTSFDNGCLKISPKKSQGKVDVYLTWQGQALKISAKNVRLKDNYFIHILSGSSLLYLIQELDSNFVNHFLNLSAHDQINNLQSIKKQVIDELKFTLILKALMGSELRGNGRSKANLFIVNDNSTDIHGIKVYNINDLINIISNEMKKNKNDEKSAIQGITIGNERTTFNENFSLKNNNLIDGENGALKRIQNILAEVHAQKINASLSISYLNTYNNKKSSTT